jgi:hypothetical protein
MFVYARAGLGIIPNNSLLYLETQNTVISRSIGLILKNFIVNSHGTSILVEPECLRGWNMAHIWFGLVAW